MKINKRTPKRLVMDIAEDLHQQLKIVALKRNMTLRMYVQRALLRALAEEEKYE